MDLSFSSAVTSVPVAVTITNDEVLEMSELFAGSLQLPAGSSDRVTIRPGSTIINIADDDCKSRVLCVVSVRGIDGCSCL